MIPDDGRSISRNVSKNNMIQDMINSDNMNSTESTIPNIFKTAATCSPLLKLSMMDWDSLNRWSSVELRSIANNQDQPG